MNYKQRKSESNNPQKIVEYSQGGVLIRFNEIELQREEGITYQCDEYWFEKTASIDEIEKVVKLTDKHKELLK